MMPGHGPTVDGHSLPSDVDYTENEAYQLARKNYLVTLTLNVTDVPSPEEAAQAFKRWLATTKHPAVNVREVPIDDALDNVEIEL